MSEEDWQAGDLALCVQDNWNVCSCGKCPKPAASPKNGQYLTVTKVHCCSVGTFLCFEGYADDNAWYYGAFRKVKPDNQPAADEEWVQQLQRFRRKEVA